MEHPMQILITTKLDDMHAEMVAMALEQRGHHVSLVHCADFPQRQSATLAYGRFDVHCEQQGALLPAFDPADAEVVWNRRRDRPQLSRTLHPDDRDFAWRENNIFADAVWRLSGRSAFWVNRDASARAAEWKPLQLRQALQVGLTIPETLISNDPRRIRAFVESNANHSIYKPLTHGDWQEASSTRVLFAASVDGTTLPDDATLQACPGIFQRRVDKHFEVRATFMGTHCMALRLDSQSTEFGHLDWRQAQGNEIIPAQPIALPDAVTAKCRALMDRLDIVFGCFDFIVTDAGDWVFLEVNQMGQFLFLEAWCPELPVLDAFCAFLLSRDPEFSYVQPHDPLRFADFVNSAELRGRLAEGREQHVSSAKPAAAVSAV
jgi:glutathione synthase/RimK-type ligase-like ATP-grasp enzyme